MTSLKNILSAMGVVFFAASCGISGETGEISDQERAAAIDEICEVSPAEDCEAVYELFNAVSFQGNCDNQGQCISECNAKPAGSRDACRKNCFRKCPPP